MTRREADANGTEPEGPPWAEADASARRSLLTGILAQVSREALQGEDLDAVLRAIVDCLVRRLPVTIASIILLDEGGQNFIQEVWAGDADLDQPGLMPWPVHVGAAGRCARTGQPQLISDVQNDPDYVVGNSAVRAEYLVPIRHRTRLHGVLNVESTRDDFFSAEACAVFDAIADQVAGAIHLARLAAELERANRELERLSMLDGLTGIANRRCFDLRLEREWRRAASSRRWLALLLIDADCFKRLNDVHGHQHGDGCLRELAGICSSLCEREDDLVARYGGEELVLLLPGREPRTARRLAERLRREVEAAALLHAGSEVAPHVTVSIGVSATVPDESRAPERLFAAADRALYRAKRSGRNRVASRMLRMPSAAAGAGDLV